ncbi:hypothetical protein [Sphingosinicella sp. CPCC 101087]|uniref:hypothetical protein n=1 Tax=Sphingosinicella sp. CPCC 101087 TaxID=2497754 RepID=UPI00101CF68B|nr:hypothetical protein [Sphingosinicella sp. CPCC 101087]
MRAWLLLLGGMLVWTIHFFVLYGLGSLFGTTPTARIGTLLVTLACLAANLAILVTCMRIARTADRESVLGWPARLGAPVAVLSIVSVAWQAFPALFT